MGNPFFLFSKSPKAWLIGWKGGIRGSEGRKVWWSGTRVWVGDATRFNLPRSGRHVTVLATRLRHMRFLLSCCMWKDTGNLRTITEFYLHFLIEDAELKVLHRCCCCKGVRLQTLQTPARFAASQTGPGSSS